MDRAKPASTVNRFLELFAEAFAELGAAAPMPVLEDLATLIHRSMDEGRRSYHRSSHVLDLCDGGSAWRTLAALFHDIVYTQLDGGLPRRARPLLDGVARLEGASAGLGPAAEENDAVGACAAVFGVLPGSTIPASRGANEFLSALVAVRALSPWLGGRDLLAVAACIEATIPFRPDRDGAVFDGLPSRIEAGARRLGIELSAGDLDGILRDAVVLANRDVSSFGDEDPGVFLANTWLLIEESNAPLSAVGVYSLREYRAALDGMEGFLSGLDAERVFHRHLDTPGAAEHAAMAAAARRNLDFSCAYLRAKILATALVEALALETGGDCPVSMLLGDIPAGEGERTEVEGHLPFVEAAADVDPGLLRVLEEGRAWESRADLNTSPLSACVHRSLGLRASADALASARRMASGEQTPMEFLETLDRRLVGTLARACAAVSTSRRERLLGIAKRFGG